MSISTCQKKTSATNQAMHPHTLADKAVSHEWFAIVTGAAAAIVASHCTGA